MIEKDGIIKRKTIKILFRPTKIEQEKNACPLYISAYEVNKGRHSFGIVDFKRNQFALESTLECDGNTFQNVGVSFCQGKLNSMQRISFKNPTEIFANEKCKSSVKFVSNVFEISIQKDLCVYLFKQNNLLHRLTTYGFEESLVY